MPERFLQQLFTDDAGLEEAAATRERLKACFPAGASRRMTQLGMLAGSLLNQLGPGCEDCLVYASSFGESRSLEAYLDSFPTASPTLFQTSIHPSGVQQALIGRQCAVRELYPLAGDDTLVGQALAVAFLSPASRSLLVGGEERGGWLRDHGAAAQASFAYALSLSRDRGEAPLARLSLTRPAAGAPSGLLSPAEWFALLQARRPYHGPLGGAWWLDLEWF